MESIRQPTLARDRWLAYTGRVTDAQRADAAASPIPEDDAVVAGFPGDRGLFVGPARVRDVLTATGADIYGEPGVAREIYSLRADIRKGASGGPVLDGSGRVVGMVFATSLDDPQTGYALTLDEVLPVLRAGERATTAVPAGACTAA